MCFWQRFHPLPFEGYGNPYLFLEGNLERGEERSSWSYVLEFPVFSFLVFSKIRIPHFVYARARPTPVTTPMTTSINSNHTATFNYTSNSNSNDTDKMNSSRSIKINFQGASREVDLPTPATLSGLQAAVASAFGVELAARSEPGGADSDLSFTYIDSDGDDIVFDKDSELGLALRLCPSPLEIYAASKQQDKEEAAKPEEAKRIYRRAARNLREYHGVPSMTPPKLVQTLAFLKLHPRRLVRLGLAPAQLLAGVKAPEPLGRDNNDDLAEAVASDMELMTVEDDRKEWNDGFVSVEDGEKPTDTADADDQAAAAAAAAGAGHSSSETEEDDEEEGVGGAGAGNKGEPKPKNVMHGAFLTAGIKLRPREVMPLFLALRVSPRRLVELGRVDGKELRAAVEGFKRRHRHQHGGGHPAIAHFRARGGGPGEPVGCMGGAPGGADCRRGAGSRGPGGKPCGPGRRVGGGSPVKGMFFCPPPPPPHADSAHGGGGGPGGFSGPHHHGQPGHPGRYGGGGGGGGGAGGCPFSPEMMVWMDARAARHISARRVGGGGRGGGGGGCGGRGGAGGGGDGGHWHGYWG